MGKIVKISNVTPQLMLLSQILETKYLWDTVRVTGGAYGCYAVMSIANTFRLISYRDPHYRKTLAAFYGIPDYLDDLQMTNEQLE